MLKQSPNNLTEKICNYPTQQSNRPNHKSTPCDTSMETKLRLIKVQNPKDAKYPLKNIDAPTQ